MPNASSIQAHVSSLKDPKTVSPDFSLGALELPVQVS